MNEGIKLVVYPVKDISAGKARFTALLGTEPYVDQPYYVGFKVGACEVGIDPNGHRHGDAPIVYFDVSDIKAAIKALTGNRAVILQDAKEVGGGLVIALLKDPDGGIVGLRQPG
jgi:predicted enzyme related to lactoylglutathione lyase